MVGKIVFATFILVNLYFAEYFAKPIALLVAIFALVVIFFGDYIYEKYVKSNDDSE